jgi:predicted Zn finger-like uncharacterized protein
MRFSCDRCDAQYMISDEKVGPNGVKVRCKKCGHVILVRRPAAEEAPAPVAPAPVPGAAPGGTGERALDAELGHAFDAAFGTGGGAPAEGAPAAAPAPDPDATQAVSPQEAAGLAARSAAPEPAATEWYVAIGQAQVGPLPLVEVRRKWEAGDVGPDSLVWRPGMGDWAPLTGVADLAAYLAPVPHGAARPRPAEAPQPVPRTSTVVAAPAAQAPRGDVSWKPVGASALAALASEEISQAPAPRTEPKAGPAAGSLVDGLPEGGGVDPTGAIPLQIKALEQTTGEAPVEKRSTVARGAAELRKQRSSARTTGWLVALLVLVVLGGAGYVGWDRYLRPAATPPAPAVAEARAPAPAPQPPSASPAPAAPAPAEQAPAVQPPPAEPAPAAAPPPPATAVAAAPQPVAKDPEPERKKAPAKPASTRASRAEKAPARAERAVARAEPAPAAQPPPAAAPAPAPAPAKKKSDLLDFDSNDSALDEALGSKPSGRSVYVPPPAGGATLPERPTDSQVNETIMTRVSSLQDCLSKASGSGVLKLRWAIAPDGAVQSLKAVPPESASSKFATCVTEVIQGLRFPKSVQGRSEVTFPFKY